MTDEGHLTALVTSSNDAIISKSLEGIVQTWNPAAERIFGWTAAAMIGESIRKLIPADRQDEEDQIIERIRAGDIVPNFQTVRQRKDGSSINVAITVSPIRDSTGRIVGASQIAHDIGEQLAIESELRESEERFRALADNIPQLAWMADPTGHLFWYNRRWYEYTGSTFAQMEGWGWSKVHHPDHLDRVVESWQAALAAGEGWEDTFPLRGSHGDYRWFLSRAMPIKNELGDITLWFGTNTDVTQQREHEEQISLLLNEVNHRSKNMLAVVQAILHQTSSGVSPAFISDFERRIAALAANQDLLVRRQWAGAGVGDIVRSQLAVLEGLVGDRIHLIGPEGMTLRPSAAEALGLAIHELTTNALKYGALSNEAGQITIEWFHTEEGGTPKFHFRWRETGGPVVRGPTRSGFGTILITRNPKSVMEADVTLDYAPTGLRWSLNAPLGKIAN